MWIKKLSDHNVVRTATCGEIREILRDGEFKGLDLALALNIGRTTAHFHKDFDEIYLVLDGSITLQTYEPLARISREQSFSANELGIIPRGTHHKISAASEVNRLCILSLPGWCAADEHASDVL